MAGDTIIYHPPKEEPSVFNGWMVYGLMLGAIVGWGSLPAVLSWSAINAVIGGTFGYVAEDRAQRDGIRAEKPPESIFNFGMLIGAVACALTPYFVAPVGASAAVVATFSALSAVAGGLMMGELHKNGKTKLYNLALQQQAEREGMAQTPAIEHAQEHSHEHSVAQYKNIPDLPEQSPTTEKDVHNWGKKVATGVVVDTIANNLSF